MNTEPQFVHRTLELTLPQIRGLIRQKLLNGTLPEEVTHEAFGGISRGSHCAACDRSIQKGNVEIDTYGIDSLRRSYHAQCHLVLSTELEDLAQR